MFNIKHILEKKGHEVYPFSIHSDKNVETEYEKYFVNPIGSREAVYYDDYQKTPKVIWQLLTRSIYSFEVKKALKGMIKDVKPDIVYIIHFVNKLSPSVISAAKEMNVPVILRLSDYFMMCPRFDFLYQSKICEDCLTKGYLSCIKKRCVKNSLFASLIRVFAMQIHEQLRIYDKVDAFVSPSKCLKQKLLQKGIQEDKINWIPTFYNGEKNQCEVGQYGLYFGRITEEKGVNALVYAYERLGNDYPLKIVGDDSTQYAQDLKKYILKNKIENIEFVGFKKGEKLNDYIKNARFAVIPSIWYDNFPNAALEAFAFCKPVIASNIGSLPELIDDNVNGYLFEAGNVEHLMKCIKKMDDKNLVSELGKNAGMKITERYSEEIHYNTLIKLFERKINENIN